MFSNARNPLSFSSCAGKRPPECPVFKLFPLLLGKLQIPSVTGSLSMISVFKLLHPPYFNLAEGTRISATATCGEEAAGAGSRRAVEDLYCKLTIQVRPGRGTRYCDICSSANSNKAHPITNAIDGTERWWQSPPLSRGLEFNQVNVTLDLGQLFHVAYVLIKFANSPRPDLWVLERSTDFGLTYEPWQYFASSRRDCIEKFGQHTVDRITRDDHAICTTEYSRIVPLENGEIVVSLVNGRPGAMNFSYSPLLRNFTKATNIRLRFLQTNTLLGHLMGKALRDPTVTRRYYYSIKDISIGGRCVCHGHADVCDAKDPSDPYRLQCDCQHNTCGGSCDRCCPGYHQFPWKPATADSANECQPCNCNGHAYDCYYDPEVDRHKASRSREDKFEGGGVCIDCQHHTTGINCERCIPGYYRSPDHPIDSPYICYRCNCESDFTDGTCEDLTGRCYCKPNYTGEHCQACAEGYLNFPHCYPIPAFSHNSTGEQVLPAGQIINCDCYAGGTEGNACRKDPRVGVCVCKPNFQGTHCDQCAPGHYGPSCQPCQCSGPGQYDGTCDSDTGQCVCRTGFEGHSCDQCAPGYFNYPLCQLCGCSAVGTLPGGCDSAGNCFCRAEFAGPRCEQCSPGYHSYPHCYGKRLNLHPFLSSARAADPTFNHCAADSHLLFSPPAFPQGSCACRAYVEGPACDRCKPGYWNLTPENPYGCLSCKCDTKGTISGITECRQGDGQCFCKANVCGKLCSACKDGYFNMENANYFGCQGCRCDVGGALGPSCEARSGACRCRQSTRGPTCTQPARDHYFPDLHHLKFELEEGTTPSGRAVRFGYNPLEFEGFSWRGYAQMSSIQPKVVVTVNVTSPDLFRLVFRYVSRGPASVEGRVSVLEEGKFNVCANCTEQTKQIVFAPSTEPAFVTVPQNSFGEPFVLNPNTWSLVVEAQGVLLDYLVLLPSSYYEAPILQLKVTEPCVYQPAPEQATQNCLLYKYLSLEGFPAVPGVDAVCRLDNRLPRLCPTEQLTPSHPRMATCSGTDVEVQLSLSVAQPGNYVLLVEYANTNALQSVGIAVSSPRSATQQGTFTFYPCAYSACWLVGTGPAVAPGCHITRCLSPLWQHKVYLIPAAQFTMELIEPKVHCISVHGTFSSNSSSCVPSRFLKLSQSIILEGAQALPIAPEVPLAQAVHVAPSGVPVEPAPRPPTAMDPTAELILLQSPQAAVVFSSRIQSLGRYAFILHLYQPSHPSFPVEVLINGGRIWQGQTNASFCPHGYGCRSLVVSEDQTILDVTDNDLTVVVRVPEGKQLWLDYILVVPEDSYTPQYLQEEPLDKSYDFISSCALTPPASPCSPSTSSRFCRDSAVSLSLFYNNGAQPCGCHEAGARGSQCQPFGGQCPCRPNVIGRQCSRCATGYWGFPNCRPCDCGSRLCDEVTGQCICPPHTLKPECVVCEPQTFGCHPLIGCEDCNCSRPGVQELTEPGCDVDSGQCRCKPNIIGRQCDLCAPGYYHYPDCRRCDCHQAGTQASVCDPVTGQCHCKENVEGLRCDQCRLGTFSLDATNPKGCTKCFCFGATDRCRSAEKHRAEFVDMNGWLLLSSDRHEVPTALSPREQLVTADLKNLPDAYQELYWVAPSSYLGDQVSSYGGHLRYELHSNPRRGDVFIPMESRPDVILKGNQMSIMFLEGAYPSPGEAHQGQLQLVEGNFRHTETHNPVSREELMMVLANLEQLQIRALFSQLSSSVSLRRVVLEMATDTATGIRASNVELCFCPANYQGDSCQECAPGYYRDTKGLFLGKCIPCHCNGHSDQCLPGSGICLNCQHNTEGDHCERCKDGYMGSPSAQEPLQCVGCPCPLSVASNNFAVGCVHKGSNMQCLCKPGYAGPNCERCAPGYFGNPLVIGSSCQPCDCSGNTDPNMLFSSCDPLTGACSGCMHHTAGARCELCAPGYYGDAVLAKNCTQCNCSPCGTDSCHPQTGQCFCKTGVTGQHCDRCEEGYYGFEGCSGCRRCDCDPVDGHSWNKTSPSPLSSVVKAQNDSLFLAPAECECRGGSCDPRTGECTCPSGLTGKQCDVCLRQHEILVANGPDSMKCEVCDSCVLLLLEDLQSIEMSFPSIRGQLVTLNASSIAWARLHGLNSTILAIAVSMSGVRQRADELEDENMDLTQDLNTLQHKVGYFSTFLFLKSPFYQNEGFEGCEEPSSGRLELLRQMARFGAENASTTSGEEFRQKLAEVERMLREMKERSLGAQEELARREHEEAQKLLHRVKSELHARWQSNQDLLSSTQEWLAQHSSQLMDLRDALNEAVNKTRQTEELNSLNRNNLEESQQKSQELQKQHALVQETLQMAKDALAQVSDFLQMMERAKEAYEKLAALLDGAKLPLTERVKKFSPASSKIPIVEQAEEHARLLDELARNLSGIIQDTNQDGFIQRAVNASNAYASIIEAVRKAEQAARDADKAASEALMVSAVGSPAKNNSSLCRTCWAGSKVCSGVAELDSLCSLLCALTVIQMCFLPAPAHLRDIYFFAEDTKDTIQNAKAAAAEANETAARVEDALSTMKKNLDEWKDQYGGLRNEDLNQAVQDARKSVSSLESTIPLLLEKLSSLENRRNKNATVSENIVRIRQLITQARNAASKVKVPMKFNGSSGVQVRMPSNLQDLAAYTSLKFYIQNPEPRSQQDGAEDGRFVLYLGSQEATGDYLGIVLKDRRVHWIYKLGDEEPTSLSVDEDIGEQFVTITINRILQYGHMSVIVERQRVHEIKGDSVAKGEQGLLNLDPRNVVFYVGGYPASFTPPPALRYPNYRGCLELDTLNEEVVSLYNFQHTFELDTAAEKPCARSKSTGDPWLTDGSYFDGSGYAEIKFESQFGTTKRFEQEIRVVSYNGIIFFLENQGQFLCLAIRDGKLALYYDFSSGLEVIISLLCLQIQIFLLKMNNKKRILVRVERLTIFVVEQENSLENAVSYYLGGVPPAVLPPSLKSLFPTGGPIRGCMKGLKALGKYVDLKRMSTVGVSYGCTSDLLVARSVSVHGHGYLTLALMDVPGLRDFYSGFSFQTSQPEGLLYHHSTQGTCQVSLQRGHLALNLLGSEVTTDSAYADGRAHYVAFYSDARGYVLYVDDELQDSRAGPGRSRRQRRQAGRRLFQLGGSPEPGALGNLSGCIGNVFVNRTSEPQMVVDLQQNMESINVTMSCPPGAPPVLGGARAAAGSSMRSQPPSGGGEPQPMPTLCNPGPGIMAWKHTCHAVAGEPGAPITPCPCRSHFSLEVKLNSSSGLLFYVAGERGSSMALFVSNGRFVFLVELGRRRLRIRSKDKYRDRRWHTVSGAWKSQGSHTGKGLAAPWHHPLSACSQSRGITWCLPAFSPSVLSGLSPQAASASSFDGCLRNPQLDGRPLGPPSRTFGVTPCYEGALESGVFFATDGGSIALADAVMTEQDLEVTLEVRPRSASGLIFHIGTRRSHHLLLYMEQTKVLGGGLPHRAGAGADEFSASVTSPALCDGQWHTIAGEVTAPLVLWLCSSPAQPTSPRGAQDKPRLGNLNPTDKASTGLLLPPLPHYVGCVRNLQINQRHVDLPRAGAARGSVGLKGCPVL
uniref:Laminin subunit alpha 5 n=1 Tax=Serinus canaria TaxID=9135 RepID=A0A8C9UHH5_SERCA